MTKQYWCVLTLTVTAAAQAPDAWNRLAGDGEAAEAAGDLVRAAGLYRESARAAEVFPAGDARRVWSWNAVGTIDNALGNFADAEAAFRRALGEAGDTAARASILSNLGLLQIEAGRPERAERFLREAVALQEAAGPPDPVRLASVRNALAEYLVVTGRIAEAEPLLTAAAASVSGADADNALNNLAVVRLAQGRTAEAQQMLQKALADMERINGRSHPILLRPLNNLATAQVRNHDDAARTTFRRAIDLAEKTLGDQHPLYAQILDNYARYLRQTGDKRRSRDLAARAARILKENARRNGIGATVDVAAFR
jgi:tetratricopeptide (TPR) repeat protein